MTTREVGDPLEPPQVLPDPRCTEEEHARVAEELARATHANRLLVKILRDDLRGPLEQAARSVSGGTGRVARMVAQLVDFSDAYLEGGVTLQHADLDLAPLAAECVAEARRSAPIAVIDLATRGVTRMACDPARVRHVLSGLLDNALAFGDESGSVEVVLDGSASGEVTLSVSNRGAMPEHVESMLFNPLRGTRSVSPGSSALGLGLYVARQIAAAHGGTLEVETTDARTRLVLRLPRTAQPRSSAAPSHSTRDAEGAAFEEMAAPPGRSTVTAQLFGVTPLHVRAPVEYADIVSGYAALLDVALERRTFRVPGEKPSDALRALGDRLGDLGAGPREVTEVHARALRKAVRGSTATKTQALLAEGRLLALELMGNLASYYRRRSHGSPRSVPGRER